jgi:hypothetical protein
VRNIANMLVVKNNKEELIYSNNDDVPPSLELCRVIQQLPDTSYQPLINHICQENTLSPIKAVDENSITRTRESGLLPVYALVEKVFANFGSSVDKHLQLLNNSSDIDRFYWHLNCFTVLSRNLHSFISELASNAYIMEMMDKGNCPKQDVFANVNAYMKKINSEIEEGAKDFTG